MCLCFIAFCAPQMPIAIKIERITSVEVFKKLNDKLELIISITILVITKKYSGTNALMYKQIFFIDWVTFNKIYFKKIRHKPYFFVITKL